MTAQSTDLLSYGPVDIFWGSWRQLYVVIKQGPIKPFHQQQILPVQQSLLITANSWRSFQRGLYQGQEHLDLNYPWHNVWPFCYQWGGQHLLRGHGPRGQQGYTGQHCKHSPPPAPPTNTHRAYSTLHWASLWACNSNDVRQEKFRVWIWTPIGIDHRQQLGSAMTCRHMHWGQLQPRGYRSLVLILRIAGYICTCTRASFNCSRKANLWIPNGKKKTTSVVHSIFVVQYFFWHFL